MLTNKSSEGKKELFDHLKIVTTWLKWLLLNSSHQLPITTTWWCLNDFPWQLKKALLFPQCNSLLVLSSNSCTDSERVSTFIVLAVIGKGGGSDLDNLLTRFEIEHV